MGVGSSRRIKNEVITSKTVRTPTIRGTSRSPPEAWDTRSEPDRDRIRAKEDWQNITNTSYNLLDLEPYFDDDPTPTPSPRKVRRPTPPSPMKKRSLSPARKWRSPSPDRKKKSPSPIKRVNHDKFKDFRNLTDISRPHKSPTKAKVGKPYSHHQRSPEKKRKESPEKSPLPALRSKSKVWAGSLSNSISSSKPYSPYESSPKKKVEKQQHRRRVNSFPELEVPKLDKSLKKPGPKPSSTTTERRLSDVSTIGLTDDKPIFRTIKPSKKILPAKPRSGKFNHFNYKLMK